MFSLVCYSFYLLFTILWFGFIYCFLSFFTDATDNEHTYLAEIPLESLIFECNFQKSVPRSLQLKNTMLSSRIELRSRDLKLL